MTGKTKILIVDDDLNSLQMLEQYLKLKDYEVTSCLTFRDAMREMNTGGFSAAILDYYMPDTTGLVMMRAIHELDPMLPVIILTASRDIKLAIETIKEGAFHYLGKPVDPDELYLNLDNAINARKLAIENSRLKHDLKDKHKIDTIIGASGKMMDVFDITIKAARVRSTVLITGETGTGKELIARAIHYNSDRADKPFISVNCSAIPESLLEAELFGIEKNIASGVDERMGKFEAADGGTLFLDEIGDMSLSTQAKVLRALQEREVERVGSHTPVNVDIRVIAATNRELEKAIKENKFRQDLYFRLNVIIIPLPPLRERLEDIPDLVDHFIKRFCAENEFEKKNITSDAMDKLLEYHWPGNVRELENTIERLVVMSDPGESELDELPVNIAIKKYEPNTAPDSSEHDLETAVQNYERKLILEALEKNGWRQNRAAEELQVSERSIWYKIKKLGIDTKRVKQTS
ncbi:Nitrogen regulation protein NR(I) [hydrothermal vent metagenome]|uniref:Nitrogen regulation protein NR(I) n=1 Tax=hydrothermal vent metagenome TaxID=652676 RepID=A0A3B1CLL4_9ZZZZ